MDYEGIRGCELLGELEGIVRQLGVADSPDFPALLRLARDRMKEVRGRSGADRRGWDAGEDDRSQGGG